MRALIDRLPQPKKELVQLGLVLVVLLVMTEEVIEVFEPTINIIETSVFIVVIGLAFELYRLQLSRYSIFFIWVAVCYNPISLFGFNEYGIFRPNWFISFVSMYLIIILQNYSSLRKDEEKGHHVRT